mgnify:CR=1 FL=1
MEDDSKVWYSLFFKFYNEAIALDVNYSPVYFTLFQYYYSINVNKSADYLEKYLTAKGSDEVNACYLRTALKASQGFYQETINKGKECIAAGGATPNPKIFLAPIFGIGIPFTIS